MEQKKRTVVKALTWQIMGFFVMTALGYITTGSIQAAGGLALGAAAIGTVTFFFHERLWARVRWGRNDTPN